MVMTISRIGTVFLLLTISLMINACSGLTQSDKPAVTSWWLQPYTGSALVETAASPVSIEVSVEAIPGLDTDQILALGDDAQLRPYMASRWVDYLPELFDSLITRSLEASDRFEVLSGRSNDGSDQCKLHLELQEFFARMNPSGQTVGVHVAMKGYFQCDSGVSKPLHLQSSESVDDQRMQSIVAAFQRATNTVMLELLQKLN